MKIKGERIISEVRSNDNAIICTTDSFVLEGEAIESFFGLKCDRYEGEYIRYKYEDSVAEIVKGLAVVNHLSVSATALYERNKWMINE